MHATVSIIVPFYNAGRYFDRCVRSLLSQTWRETEFIFVDDGSQDDSRQQLEALLEGPFRERKEQVRILVQENAGVCRARQAGLEAAGGDYLLFADADDWVEPVMVEKLVRAARASDSDLVCCGYCKEYGDRTVFREEAEYRRIRPLLSDLIAGRNFHGYLWNKLFRRSLLQAHELCWPVASIRDDLVLTYQLAYYARKITWLPDPLYHYRLDNPGSLMHQDDKVRTRLCARNQLHLFDFYYNRPRPNPVSAARNMFLAETFTYIWKADAWDLVDDYPYLWKEVRHMPLPAGMLRRIGRYLRLRKALCKKAAQLGFTK